MIVAACLVGEVDDGGTAARQPKKRNLFGLVDYHGHVYSRLAVVRDPAGYRLLVR